MKKRILIFFPEGNLPYAPSALNLYDELAKTFEVEVLSKNFGSTDLRRNVTQLGLSPGKITTLLFRAFKFLNFRFDFWYEELNTLQAYRSLKGHLKKKKYNEVIAFDMLATAIAQRLHPNVHFFSLEISSLKWLNQVQTDRLRSVIIQRRDRYEYLFKNEISKIFYVQNAPVYKGPPIARKRDGLIFSGYASKGFGIYACINFINKYSQYHMVVKGVVESGVLDNIVIHFDHLEREGRLVFDRSYVDEREMQTDLSRFRVGFCFYDFRFPNVNNFNYLTAPSGKLFRYFAAGVPVIAIDIPGLSYVREFEAGVLIPDLAPQSIKTAIETIEKDYDRFSSNCLRAAEHFSFDSAVRPFIEYLTLKR